MEEHVKLAIESGTLQTTGRVQFAKESDQTTLSFTGNLQVAGLATVDQILFQEFVKWDRLAVDGIDFALSPKKAAVERVALSGLKTSVIISSNKLINLTAVLPSKGSTNMQAHPGGIDSEEPPMPQQVSTAPDAAPAASAAPSKEAFPVELREFRLENATVRFEDQSVQPACVIDIAELGGSIKGLSSSPDSTADVELSGKIDEGSPFAIRGNVNPLASDMALNLTFTNSNLQLTPFTPYTEKFIGHPLNKGRLSLGLTYALKGKELNAENKVAIDQLMLGPRNDNPDATTLPVKLGVALLKDSNGRIALDVPVHGRLDDPKFRIGPIILDVIGNLIVKAAASPFKLIGSLVGGGEELSFVEFDPGVTSLAGGETNKLDKLAQALEKRPALNLEIEGSVDPVADREALARAEVRSEMKRQRLRELTSIGQAPPSADSFELDPADYERLLRAAVVSTYGTNLAEAARTVAEKAVEASEAAAAQDEERGPGLFKRVTSIFRPRQERAAIRQAYRALKADSALLEQNPELARLSANDMELLLAAKVEISPDAFRRIMEQRSKAVQSYLLASGKVDSERLFLVKPKAVDANFKGEARVNLSLN